MNPTETVLYAASRSGKFREVHDILHSASVEEVNLENFDLELATPLMAACRFNHVDTVFALLTYPGIDVNVQNKFSQSALMIASDYDHIEVVRALLVHPTLDVNQQDERGMTVLMAAANRRHDAVVRALLDHPKIDVHREDLDGMTAMVYAHSEDIQMMLYNYVQDHPRPSPTAAIAAALAEAQEQNRDLQSTIDALSTDNTALKRQVEELSKLVATLQLENTQLFARIK